MNLKFHYSYIFLKVLMSQFDMQDPIIHLAKNLGNYLSKHQLTVTTVESCTGGLIAGAITEISGSSKWYKMGFVTYANEAKEQLVKVSAKTLEEEGAVSEAVVRQMVAGGLSRADADVAIAVSGIAGPTGGSPDKPVGTVWIACGGRDGDVYVRRFLFQGDRHSVRRQTVQNALSMAMELLMGRTSCQ